jgi:hypothetical protein
MEKALVTAISLEMPYFDRTLIAKNSLKPIPLKVMGIVLEKRIKAVQYAVLKREIPTKVLINNQYCKNVDDS